MARIKRRFLKKPYHLDNRYPGYWLDQYYAGSAASVVQIGSNDGKTGDPIHALLLKNKKWNALLVEPVPYIFEKLKKNYPDNDRFRFENVAINHGEHMTFYWVDESAKKALPNLPYWFDQLGSFDKQHILKHFDGALAPFIKSATIEGIALDTLLERNDIGKIDFLHIDTEGYDWKILSQLDQKKYTPKFILYEHSHLSREDCIAAEEFLDANYMLFRIGIDTLAVNRNIDQAFLEKLKEKWN